jgi:hypothetical protein
MDGVEIPVSQIPGLAPGEYEEIAVANAWMPKYCWVDQTRFVGVHGTCFFHTILRGKHPF